MSERKYLIVRLAALGDVVMTSALVRKIRERDAHAHITWLCGQRVQELVNLFGVDEIVAVDEVGLLRGGRMRRLRALSALWRRLGGRRFDITLLAHADARYRALLTPVRTGRLRALEHGITPRTLPIPGRYFGDEVVRLLDESDSRGPIERHSRLAEILRPLPMPERPGSVGVVLLPGGARNVMREDALRRWPVAAYRELAQRLLEAGHRVTLVGDAGDAWVRPYFAGLGVRDEIGRHDVTGTLGLLRAGELVIVHDTGVLHLARLAGTPVIGLFGPTIPTKSLVEAPDVVALWGGADLACRPCYNGREYADCRDNICMQRIRVSDVMRHVDVLVAERRLGASDDRRPRVTTV
jgi:heptosyltransferase-2